MTPLRALMAVIFGLGAVIMVAGAVLAWVLVIAMLGNGLHWAAGAGFFVGSFFAMQHHPETLAAPWQMWMGLWAMMDDWLAGLEGKKDEAPEPCDPDAPKRLRYRG